MSNVEQAKEIARKWYYDNANPNDAAYRAAYSMGEWKDSQLKQLISEHMEHATGQRLEAFMDLYRELFEQNAPEKPQATRLSTTQPSNIAEALSTPRELCINCYNWLTPENNYDLPHCLENAYDCRAYLLGTHDYCPKNIVL